MIAVETRRLPKDTFRVKNTGTLIVISIKKQKSVAPIKLRINTCTRPIMKVHILQTIDRTTFKSVSRKSFDGFAGSLLA